jgi:hypothetical protein
VEASPEIPSLLQATYDEVGFLLRQELREPRVYQAILAAIAQGAEKIGELGSKTGLDKANLSRYLAQLAELNLVRRDVPVTERLPHKSRKGLHRVADLFTAGPLSHLVPFQVRHAGRHWSRDAEFDLVLFDETRRQAFVGEVKWTRRPISPRHPRPGVASSAHALEAQPLISSRRRATRTSMVWPPRNSSPSNT